MSGTYVALLRAINVGGRNTVPMPALVRMFADAGCRHVVSYIQSGNVVFDAPARVAKGLSRALEERIAVDFGWRVPVVLRAADEISGLVLRNPYLTPDADHGKVVVAFLADAPTAAAIATLDPQRSPPDEFLVSGREIFLHCPNGLGRTKLTNDWFESRLGTHATARNWRTVLKLVELATR